MTYTNREKLEIEKWKQTRGESSLELTKGNFLLKTREARNFDYKVRKYRKVIEHRKSILEVGSGQGWASCFLKRFYTPEAHFTVTDISPDAVAGISHWEKVYDVQIENVYACKCYDIPEPDGCFDLIFCYSAAHHFEKHRETLIELKRVLKSNGVIIFLYEPTCPRLFYPLYYRYVNTGSQKVVEDVLIPHKIKKICQEVGLSCRVVHDPTIIIKRKFKTNMYLKLLKHFSFLQKWMPVPSEFVFRHKK